MIGQAFKSLIIASLSMPVGTRVLLLAHIAMLVLSYVTSRDGFLGLLCLQPHKTIFNAQGWNDAINQLPIVS